MWAVLGLIVVLGGIFIYMSSTKTPEVSNTLPTDNTPSIVGCYVGGNSKDIYTMRIIMSQNGENVSGTLAFKNFEKDSSSGTFTGTYKNGILLGDYSFNSEGMTSLMQVAFQKSGDNFVRGYGDVNADGTSFVDTSKIVYDSNSTLNVFVKGQCVN